MGDRPDVSRTARWRDAASLALVLVGTACWLRAYVGLAGIRAADPRRVLTGAEPDFLLAEVQQLMRLSYLGVGLLTAGVLGAALSFLVYRRDSRS